MTEPAFFALSEEAVQIGCGLDGPYTDSLLATAPFEISDGSYHDYDWNHAACVNIDLSEIENRLTEDEEVTSAGLNALNDKFGGLKLMKISQSSYDNLQVKDNNTLYIISD